MNAETITVTNSTGTEITLYFNSENLVQDHRRIVLRVPAQFGTFSRFVIIASSKINYPTEEEFLNRVEQFGKQYLAQWLQSSSDSSIIMPFSDIANKWTIGIE